MNTTTTTAPVAANRPAPTSIVRRNRPARLGAILLMCGPLGYWLGELITAAAWQDPAPAENPIRPDRSRCTGLRGS